jgi:hypothetical protein
MPDTRTHAIELRGVFAHILGVWYPRDHVVAAIDAAQGSKAVKALLAAGFGANAVHLHASERVLQSQAKISRRQNKLERDSVALARAVTDDGLMAEEYLEEAKAGASVIAVLAPEPRLSREAARILAAHGARRIRFYGNTTITDLP